MNRNSYRRIASKVIHLRTKNNFGLFWTKKICKQITKKQNSLFSFFLTMTMKLLIEVKSATNSWMNNAFSKLWTPILIVIRQTMINSITSFCVLKCCQIVSGETSRIKYAAVSNALGEARRKKSKNQMVFIGNSVIRSEPQKPFFSKALWVHKCWRRREEIGRRKSQD